MLNESLSVYIHTPFCLSKCSYCDFFSVPFKKELYEGYKKSLFLEIKEALKKNIKVKSVYFGGGTPSALPESFIPEIMNILASHTRISEKTEITAEANPSSISRPLLSSWKKAGVTRTSIGIQSFKDEDLSVLGRLHNSETARKSIRISHSFGPSEISLDLIFAVPGQKLDSYLGSLREASKDADHISAYGLSIPNNSKMDKEGLKVSEENYREMFLKGSDFLTSECFIHYEVSNFSRKNKHSRHNSSYWNGSEYAGLGPGAHSFINKKRYANASSIEKYITASKNGFKKLRTEDKRSASDKMFEDLFLGLRTKRGYIFGEMPEDKKKCFLDRNRAFLEILQKRNLAFLEKESLRLTPEGMLLMDNIIENLSIND
ncbi:MAG: radical SAM family heme chaperone HemW [Fibrobacterota bacterium]